MTTAFHQHGVPCGWWLKTELFNINKTKTTFQQNSYLFYLIFFSTVIHDTTIVMGGVRRPKTHALYRAGTHRTTDAMPFISICSRHSIKVRSQAASLNDEALKQRECPLTFAAAPCSLGLSQRLDRASNIDLYLLLCAAYTLLRGLV